MNDNAAGFVKNKIKKKAAIWLHIHVTIAAA